MSILTYDPQLLLADSLAIPSSCILPQDVRKAAWKHCPPKPMPDVGYQRSATQIAYYQSIEDDKARQRAKDEVRWAALKARRQAEKDELAAVATAVKRRGK
jgi:hypothetical protein